MFLEVSMVIKYVDYMLLAKQAIVSAVACGDLVSLGAVYRDLGNTGC